MEQVKDIVFPGDIIAKEEEYLSGKNTGIDKIATGIR